MTSVGKITDAERTLSHALVQASKESWAKSYKKTPKLHAKLITTQTKLAKGLRKYFRDLADRAPNFIDWSTYHQVKADKLQLKVVFNDQDFFDSEDGEFMDTMYDPIAIAAALGAAAGEQVYGIPLGLNGSSAAIQKAARGQIAQLVGKQLDKSGNIVNNPNPKYNINETTRSNIEESIRTSLTLGKSQEEAIDAMRDIINDPARAEMIANTESVNAYQQGKSTYAHETDAVGKEWLTINADDECAENADAGVISIDDTFPSGDDEPTAHPNCLCDLRYVYQQEADDEEMDL